MDDEPFLFCSVWWHVNALCPTKPFLFCGARALAWMMNLSFSVASDTMLMCYAQPRKAYRVRIRARLVGLCARTWAMCGEIPHIQPCPNLERAQGHVTILKDRSHQWGVMSLSPMSAYISHVWGSTTHSILSKTEKSSKSCDSFKEIPSVKWLTARVQIQLGPITRRSTLKWYNPFII